MSASYSTDSRNSPSPRFLARYFHGDGQPSNAAPGPVHRTVVPEVGTLSTEERGSHILVMRRVPALLALSMVLILTLAGCTFSSSRPSRPDKTIHHELSSIPGVTRVDFLGGPNGLPTNVKFGAALTFTADSRPAITPLLNYLLAEIWSDTETHPNTGVFVAIDEGTTPVDLTPAAHSLGLKNVGNIFFKISARQMTKRYGPWPGKPPTLPTAFATPTP